MVVGDGTSLKISHFGSSKLTSPTASFSLHNTLCVPQISNNLISVSKFCKSNNVAIEYHPLYFLVKDRTIGVTLLKGPNNGDLYHLPSTPATFVSPKVLNVNIDSTQLWHSRLGHLL